MRTIAIRGDPGGRWEVPLRLLAVATGYYLAARLGLALAVVGNDVTPLWPPTGVALVAFLAFGPPTWPAIAVGAFAANLTSSPPLAAAGIAVGNTLAPLTAAYLLRHTGLRTQLDRVRDALAIVFVGALGAMVISATIGSTTLLLADEIERRDFLETWSVWWTGDAMGVLIVAPFLWSLRSLAVGRRSNIRAARVIEACSLFALLAGSCLVAVYSEHEMLFVTLPLLGGIAWRFQQRGAAPAGLLVSLIVISAAARDAGPFEGETLLGQMVFLHTFNAAVAFTSFFFAAAVTERRHMAERQHRVAETLQRSLLPERLPHAADVALATRYIPATSEVAVGGDWYDIITLSENRLGLVIGDVAGHGIGSAATMGHIRMALRAYALEALGPAQALARLNRVIRELNPTAMATVLYAHLEPASGRVRFASAGHLPPLVIDTRAAASYANGGRSVPLGVAADIEFQEATVQLPAGATLVLYTDGLIERRTESIDDRLELLRRIAAAGPRDVDELCDRVVNTLLPDGPSDDVALLAVQLCAVASAPDRLSLRAPATPESVPATRHAISRWLFQNQIDSEQAFEVLVAASEACANAVQHAYGIAEGTIEIDAYIVGDELVITIRDRGRWRVPDRSEPTYGGNGVMIMRALMDAVDVASSAAGTEVCLRRRVEVAVPHG
ncbi:MAG: ATP-binding SpoIIE family protein phosphatase [Actinomycetota bacterium]